MWGEFGTRFPAALSRHPFMIKHPLAHPVVLALLAMPFLATSLFGQASPPRPNNEKPEKVTGQVKRIHPHALKLILQGKRDEAVAYLEATEAAKINPDHTQLLLDIVEENPKAWKFDAETWPWERTLPNTSLKADSPTDQFTIAFGGGAGYVVENERMWDTIGAIEPRALLLLGDNVYIDDPETPAMQRFHYYRRQRQPEACAAQARSGSYPGAGSELVWGATAGIRDRGAAGTRGRARVHSRRGRGNRERAGPGDGRERHLRVGCRDTGADAAGGVGRGRAAGSPVARRTTVDLFVQRGELVGRDDRSRTEDQEAEQEHAHGRILAVPAHGVGRGVVLTSQTPCFLRRSLFSSTGPWTSKCSRMCE